MVKKFSNHYFNLKYKYLLGKNSEKRAQRNFQTIDLMGETYSCLFYFFLIFYKIFKA